MFGSLSFRQRKPDSERLNVSAADGRFEVADVSVGKVELAAWPRGRGREGKYDYLRTPLTLAAHPAVQDLGDVELIANKRPRCRASFCLPVGHLGIRCRASALGSSRLQRRWLQLARRSEAPYQGRRARNPRSRSVVRTGSRFYLDLNSKPGEAIARMSRELLPEDVDELSIS